MVEIRNSSQELVGTAGPEVEHRYAQWLHDFLIGFTVQTIELFL